MRRLRKTVRRTRAAYRVIAPFGAPYRRHLVNGALASLVLVAARLAVPWPLRGAMEVVFHQKGSRRVQRVVGLVPHYGDQVVWLIGAFVVIILVWGVSESRQRLSFTRYAIGLTYDVRNVAVEHLSVVDPHVSAPGDLVSTVTGDSSRLKSGIKSILIGISRNGLFFLGVAVVITVIDPVVGAVFVTGGLATVAAGALGASRTSRIVRRSRERAGALAERLHRHLAGEEVLDASPQGRHEPDSKATRVEGLTTFSMHAILAATTCAMLLLTISQGRAGTLSAGSVFTILAYVLLMHNKTVSLGRSVVRVGRVLPSAERIAGLLRQPTGPMPQQGQTDADDLRVVVDGDGVAGRV